MSEPLGRDRLGRLVYEGDEYVNCCGHRHKAMICGAYGTDEVDLAASPKHTNYGRYFADIELSRVLFAIDAICCGQCARDPHNCSIGCPFDNWSKLVYGHGYCRSGFRHWLQQEATI